MNLLYCHSNKHLIATNDIARYATSIIGDSCDYIGVNICELCISFSENFFLVVFRSVRTSSMQYFRWKAKSPHKKLVTFLNYH